MLFGDLSSDLMILMSPLGMQSAFIMDTEEHQEGRLTGTIRMRYLVVPSFSATDGLSGGAIVTTYSKRDHPLHHPTVMANTRIGRYVRDNATGEWLILTRNEQDNVTRMQWLYSRKSTSRERICLTCNTTLFNSGQLLKSILFECHDEEWRRCPFCFAHPNDNCPCPPRPPPGVALPKHPLDLPTVAASALRERRAEWKGRVRVSILARLSQHLPPDVNACMQLKTRFETSQDSALALQMQGLAIRDSASAVVPKALPVIRNAAAVLWKRQHQAQEQERHIAAQNDTDDDTQLQLVPNVQNRAGKPLFTDAVVPEVSVPFDAVPTTQAQRQQQQQHQQQHHEISPIIANGHAPQTAPQEAQLSLEAIAMNGIHRISAEDTFSFGHEPQLFGAQMQQAHPRVAATKSFDSLLDPLSTSASGEPTDVSIDTIEIDATWPSQKEELSQSPVSSAEMQHTSPARPMQQPLPPQPTHPPPHVHTQISHPPPPELCEAFRQAAVAATPGTSSIAHSHAHGDLQPQQTPVNAHLHAAHAHAHAHVNTSPHAHSHSPPHAHVIPEVQMDALPIEPDHMQPDAIDPNHIDSAHSASPSGSDDVASPLLTSDVVPDDSGAGVSLDSMITGPHDVQVDENGDADMSNQPLARLEPRPPGMSNSHDAAWVWHMGPRGPFGMAAIAVARERELRAAERRRKNREAASRSNARAKERLERIKGELEKNKERILSLSRRQMELQAQNGNLRAQLGQQAR